MLRRMRRRDVLRAARAALGAAAIASPALAQLGTAMPSFDRTPDKPQSFGYKVLWFAVRASDPASVLDALEFGPGTQANWASGLSAAYDYGTEWAFVSPPVDGWVFVVGGSLPQPFALNPPLFKVQHEIGRRFDVLLSRLMKKFDDVQYFGTHRVVSLGAWARALNGKPVRIFAFAAAGLLNVRFMRTLATRRPKRRNLSLPILPVSRLPTLETEFSRSRKRRTQKKWRLSQGGSRHPKRGREFGRTAAHILMSRRCLTLQLCGASTLRSYQFKIILQVWDWQLPCRRT